MDWQSICNVTSYVCYVVYARVFDIVNDFASVKVL